MQLFPCAGIIFNISLFLLLQQLHSLINSYHYTNEMLEAQINTLSQLQVEYAAVSQIKSAAFEIGISLID